MAAGSEVGRIAIFTARVLVACLTPPIYLRELFRQCVKIGFYSLPVVGLTAVLGPSLRNTMIAVGIVFYVFAAGLWRKADEK